MRSAETVSYVAVTTTPDNDGGFSTSDASPVNMLALVAARSAAESVDPRSPAVLVGKTLYLLQTTITPGASDWFTVRGKRYEVDGEAHRWGSKGVEVAVKRADTAP